MEQSVANTNAITLPDGLDLDFELALPIDIDVNALPEAEEGLIKFNVAPAAEITIPDAEGQRGHTGDSTSREPSTAQRDYEDALLDKEQGEPAYTDAWGEEPGGPQEPAGFEPDFLR